jgi:hypothetical protein
MAIEQLAKSKVENVYIIACHFDSIIRNCDERAGECGYVLTIFIF